MKRQLIYTADRIDGCLRLKDLVEIVRDAEALGISLQRGVHVVPVTYTSKGKKVTTTELKQLRLEGSRVR